MEEIVYNEHLDRVDISGSNHWLPAYGYQQPTQLQQALLQQERDADLFGNDGGTLLIAGQQSQFLFLETILEETSDDLRSESDRSETAGWPDSDSGAESVIHVTHALGCCDSGDWSGSERDLAVPKKRRRRTEDEEEDQETASISSRSSSLLQFECLEKHCEDVFRTTATSDPFHDMPSPSVTSNFSFDSLESNRWRFSGSPDSLDEGSQSGSSSDSDVDEGTSSDDTLHHSSWSSSRGSSFRSSGGRLRSFRSFDSLNLLNPPQQHQTLSELSQSLGDNALLQETSQLEFRDNRIDMATTDLPLASQEDEARVTRLVTKCVTSSPSKAAGKEDVSHSCGKPPQRSAENLSEDSGFGDHVPSSSVAREVTVIAEDEDSCYSDCSGGSGSSGGRRENSSANKREGKSSSTATKALKLVRELEFHEGQGWGDEAKFSSSCWQSAPDLSCREEERSVMPFEASGGRRREDSIESEPDLSFKGDACDGNVIISNLPDKIPVMSTPNLTYNVLQDFLDHERQDMAALNDAIGELLKKGPTSKSLTPLPTTPNSSCKGVHFSPIVSQVSWRDSYSDDDSAEVKLASDEDDVASSDSGAESVKSEEKEQEPTPMLQKIQIGVPVGPPESGERERVVMELQPQSVLTPPRPVTPTNSPACRESSTLPVAAMEPQRREDNSRRASSESSTGSSTSNKKSRFGNFFQRFSWRRLSTGGSNNKKAKDIKKVDADSKLSTVNKEASDDKNEEYEDVRIIPLHPPADEVVPTVLTKPPLPPLPPRSMGTSPARRRPDAAPAPGGNSPAVVQKPNVSSSSSMSRGGIDRRDVPRKLGLLETDLDAAICTPVTTAGTPNKKARSLLDLGDSAAPHGGGVMLKPPSGGGVGHHGNSTDARAKSMEFLLDKENQAAIQPPENELQKGGAGERVMSEHQLRVQRSLQKLDVPDWYKNSTVARGSEGFILKKDSHRRDSHGWPGLSSKTTSLSSLGSGTATARSPTSQLLSPSPTPHVFTRWSTSRLNSGATSTSTSPCGSTRSSFNYRQPYLGWRSQERLSKPRTPAERLAVGLLSNQTNNHVATSPERQPTEEDLQQAQQVPNLSEVRTSIKEVTSAIVHYVSEQKDGSGEMLSGYDRNPNYRWDESSLSPRGDTGTAWSSSRSTSPRGSGRLCWLESSFVGTRPLDSPETPLTLPSTDVNKVLVESAKMGGGDLCLKLEKSVLHNDTHRMNGSPNSSSAQNSKTSFQSSNEDLWQLGSGLEDQLSVAAGFTAKDKRAKDVKVSQVMSSSYNCPYHPVVGPEAEQEIHEYSKHHHVYDHRSRPSPGSTTLEDVLDSLLGLPSASRTPSPGPIQAPGQFRPHLSSTSSDRQERRSCSDGQSDVAGSASDGERSQSSEPPPYYVGDTLRRHSEGSDPGPRPQIKPAAQSGRTGRRVSFDIALQQQPQEIEQVWRCLYSKCGKTAPAAEARRTFKTCHNCSHVYCSRECRRAHWERHRKTCLHSRVGTLCRQVITTVKEDPQCLKHLSLLARRGYLSQNRGAVKCFFSCPELAECFVTRGLQDLGEPAYVRWSDLLPGEMGPAAYSDLLKLCKSYNPDTKFVIYVAICVVSEIPTSGAVKWDRHVISKYTKIRLCRSVDIPPPVPPPHSSSRRSSPHHNITREMEDPETLILTSPPGGEGENTVQRFREISFTNIQRQLRQRGVSLKRHFPDVYKRLCAYVDGSSERFTPVTICPKDSSTGKTFVCIIMPDAEPEKLELVPKDSSRVHTIDVSREHATS